MASQSIFIATCVVAAVGADAVLLGHPGGVSRGHSQEIWAEQQRERNCIPLGMRAVKTRSGFKMVVLGNDDYVSKDIANHGSWEDIRRPEDMVPKNLTGHASMPANGTFLDIGANIGYYTMVFAKKGYNVIAVEPMTRNRKALEGSLCLNPELQDRVTVVATALVSPDEASGKKCVIRSTNKQANVGNGFLRCGSKAEVRPCARFEAHCENVPVKTLDAILSELAPKAVDVVKVDVENHECQVLAGGRSLFQKYHPKWLQLETSRSNTKQCVLDAAKRYSYTTVLSSDHLNTAMYVTKAL